MKILNFGITCLLGFIISAASFADHGTTPDVDTIDGSGPGTYDNALVAITDRADWFSFSGTAGTAVTIETTAGTFDTHLQLYSTPGTPAAGDLRANYVSEALNDDGGVGLLSKIVINLPVTGNYMVAVEAFGDANTEGSYTLEISGNVFCATNCAPPAPIPANATWAIILLISLVITFGLFTVNSRRV